jgi:nucleoside-diphosphate-sugar epimerase
MPKEKVLVTGGAGFIGSHLVEALLGKYTVRVLDNFSTGASANLDAVMDTVDVIDGDVRSKPDVEDAMRGVRRVVHLAALPGVARSVDAPLESHASNIDGTLTILEVAAKSKISRFVLAGSAAVYGDVPILARRESSPTEPTSPYGVSKLGAEAYALLYHATHKLPVVCLRCFNVYGPRQDTTSPYASVVPNFLSAVQRREPFPIYGDGHHQRDYTYVGDLVRAIQAALVKPKAVGNVFNIASGKPRSVLEVARTMAKVAGLKSQVKFFPPRLGDPRKGHADIRAAKRLLGYNPKVSFEEGLRRTYEWFTSSARS